MIQYVKDFDGKKLLDVSKEGVKFNEYNLTKVIQDNKLLIDFIKNTLYNKVFDVKISDKLKNTPCILSTSNYGYSANMERIVKSQALRSEESETSKKIFEININHKIFESISNKLKDRKQIDKCSHTILLLYETSLLNSGFILNKPGEYANKVNKMIELDIC
jgi:molecular chaperone HtpG